MPPSCSDQSSVPTDPGYAELQVLTNFSFLSGGSHAEELAVTAANLGLGAIAVTDHNTLAGAVRMHAAAKEAGIRCVIGAWLTVTESDASLLAYPSHRAAYARLSRLITLGRRRAPKGECELTFADIAAHAEGMLFIVIPPEDMPVGHADDGSPAPTFTRTLTRWRAALPPDSVWLAASHRYRGDDRPRIDALAALAAAARVPLIATGDIRLHAPERKSLLDVLACVRHHCTLATAGWRLDANAERHLKPPREMRRLFRQHPGAIAETVRFAARCRFSLDELRYEYPEEVSPHGRPAQDELAHQTWAGAARRYPPERYPGGIPAKVQRQLDYELDLIRQLGFAPYFLTVYDIVRFAGEQGILCQGRGSAANSAVCFCLGITAVDPASSDLLFERFISAERSEPPDIDVDFEHERREEVIQYIYAKYGRHRAGLAATVICYRWRAAVREVGKVIGLGLDLIEKLGKTMWGGREGLDEDRLRQAGIDPHEPAVRTTLDLATALVGFPRHLSQHVGGFVIARGRLDEVVPIQNAAMADRTVIEWDKDDLEALGMIKVDVLALGMLSCVRRAFALLQQHYEIALDLATVPSDDEATYDMLCRGDSLGVFQVESRAQMAMLPRLRPRCFYDLVVEVAIVRPGPIQGDMVHPYLRRRMGLEPVAYPSDALRAVLERTLGVPLFQEQAMKIAIVAAGFTPSEADHLRRAMRTFRKVGTIHTFQQKVVAGMIGNGYDPAFAERCFRQIEGFGEYGFPESHAASFALLVYVSSWLKCHYPEVFAAALLNAQPLGFYAPAQIVRDAQAHGAEVRAVDINHSDWDCTLEPGGPNGRRALRLGLRQVKGLKRADAEQLLAARGAGYRDPHDAWRRGGVSAKVLEVLAKADTFGSMGLDRRAAGWAVKPLGTAPLPLFAHLDGPEQPDPAVRLPPQGLGEQVVADYCHIGLSLKRHPMALLRPLLDGAPALPSVVPPLAEAPQPPGNTLGDAPPQPMVIPPMPPLRPPPKPPLRPKPVILRLTPAADLATLRDGTRLTCAGVVLVRQRPGTAQGVIFMTLEDETGVCNGVILPPVFARFRPAVLAGRMIALEGRLQHQENVIHLLAHRVFDLTDRLNLLMDPDADVPTATILDRALSPADEVRRPIPERRLPTPLPDRTAPTGKSGGHPRNRRLFTSRDFH